MNAKITTRLILLIFIGGIFFSCQEPTNHEEPPYEGPPKQIISIEQAREMYSAYSQRRVPIIQKYEDTLNSDSTKFTPTRYVEYDLKTIKQYIAYIEHEANEANVEINTLRFYLSNYGKEDKFGDGNVVIYPRRNSIFVVPTMEHDGKNVGFYIEDSSGKYTARPISGYAAQRDNEQNKTKTDSTGQMNEAGFFTATNSANQGGGTTSVILNDGQLGPPPGKDDFGNN